MMPTDSTMATIQKQMGELFPTGVGWRNAKADAWRDLGFPYRKNGEKRVRDLNDEQTKQLQEWFKQQKVLRLIGVL